MSYDKVINNMKEDMKKIKEEWERKLSDEELENQRKLVEQETKHSLKMQNV